jgi:hypothetical protein
MATEVSAIEIGYQVYLDEGGEEFGAVREVVPGRRSEVVIYVENAGDFTVSADAIRSVHDGKVVLDPRHLDERLRDAIAHAHDLEEPGR